MACRRFWSRCQRLKHVFFGSDTKMHRLVGYWGASATLHLLTATVFWFNARFDTVDKTFCVLLTLFQFIGLAAFLICVRGSRHFGFTPQQLGSWQGYHAIICIAGAYSCVPTVRGAILLLALVVLVFCAFSMTAPKARRLGMFTIILLGFTMFYMAINDPQNYPPVQEATHFILAASMVIAVAILTGQFSVMRLRLKEKQAEIGTALERIKLLAAQDMLTRLPNRQHMTELLTAEERRHQVRNESLCIAVLDIDFFKQVNDTYDHAAGDDVLRGFADQFKQHLRGTDVLARWGGEEFLFLLPRTDKATAEKVLRRIQLDLQPVSISSRAISLQVTFSAGIAELLPGMIMADAIAQADHAMYQAKASGRNTTCVFDSAVEDAIVCEKRFQLEIAKAIAQDELIMHYDPQVSAAGLLFGAEAVVHWRHPQKGMLGPDSFMSSVDNTELATEIMQWTLSAVCRQIVAWGGNPVMAQIRVSVNVNAKAFDNRDFIENTLSAIRGSGVDPARLMLQMDESMLINDSARKIANLEELKSHGVPLSLNRFGISNARVVDLENLPIKQIKIDRSIVANLLKEGREGLLARSLVGFISAMGYEPLATGVENPEQRLMLIAHGCKQFQGSLFNLPLTADHLAKRCIALNEIMPV